MQKKLLFLFLSILLMAQNAKANYTTPGTGVRLNFSELVMLSGGNVTYADEVYHVNDTITISLNDTLHVNTDLIVNFAVNTLIDVNGAIRIDPPTGVVFTAENKVSGFLGLRLNASNSSLLRKFTLEYAVSLRMLDCSIIIDSCLFQYNNNNVSTSFGNGSLALFRASPVISNSRFLNNQRAAIQGGSNISNAPKVTNCLFSGNNTANQNVPQINLGATGADTAKFINNQFLRSSTNSGAIGFLPSGSVYAIITGNLIKNNRYGITFNGGSNITAVVSYNIIDSNNTQGDPLLGGSGISFSGGSASSHQNVIVTGNLIRWNLWGITIGATSTGGGAMPNLGNLSNTDTSDDGKNQFINNHNNSATPDIDLYNNNVDPIFAQNNYWGTSNTSAIEDRIFHQADNAALGLVTYLPAIVILPVELAGFSLSVTKGSSTLKWKTLSENNSDHFEIEKSFDGQAFSLSGIVNAVGTCSSPTNYTFQDNTPGYDRLVYYRLKMVDKDGRYKYSQVLSAKLSQNGDYPVHVFPTIVSNMQPMKVALQSKISQAIKIRFFDNAGRLMGSTTKAVSAGTNNFDLAGFSYPVTGVVFIRFSGEGINQTLRISKQ